MTQPPLPAAAIAAVRDAAKAHLRTDGDSENDLIAAQATAAVMLCEAFTGISLVVRDWTQAVARDGRWQRLAMAPVVSIATVADGAIDIDASGDGWVRLPPGDGGSIDVTYSAGLAVDWAGVPAPILQGVVLLTAHLFDNRPDGGAPPAAVAALWRPYRRLRLGVEHAA